MKLNSIRISIIAKAILCSPIIFYCIILYNISKNKKLINSDIARSNYKKLKGLIILLLINKEFRNIFYYRIGLLAYVAKFFLKENSCLHIMTKEIGPGLIVVHGDCTYLNANKIGKNCYVNQCVTIGVIGMDAPVIGDNVRIASGAIVLGKITVGDNVNIGAGAVVVKNIPNNCTVVGNPARIVKKDGKRVEIIL